MADIDSLSIEIGASSKNAVSNVNKLIDAMKALKTATAGIDSGAVGKLRDLSSALKTLGEAKNINISSKLGQNIGALAGAMKAVKSEDISKLRQVASAIKTLDGLKGININSKLAKNLVDVASAVELLEKAHFDKIKQFGDALKALGGENISINKNLADRIKEIAAAVDTISTDSLDKIRQLTKALARLKGMGDVRVNISGAGSASANRRSNSNNQQQPNVPQNSGQQNAGGGSGSGQTGGKEQIQWTLSLRKNISLIAAEWSKVGQTIAAAIPAPLRLVLSIVGGIAKSVWNVAKGIAKWAFNTALSAVKRIASGIKSIAKGVVDVGKNLVKNWYDRSIFKSLANEFERIRNILSTFGRIAFYRAVRSAIKYVTDALQQGTENAYWFSKKFGDATNYISEAFDRMSSSNFKMSNQLGAAWSTLIATIEPIIIQIINLVTKAAEAVTQFFAILGGKTTYLKAIDYSKDWADETEKGSKAAKEWKNQLMGFDEINRLEAPSETDTGSNADKYKDYDNMFEEAEVSDFFKKIKDLINSGQWAELGTMLGKKFNDIVNNFDWAGWGTKIGRGIQHGIDLAYNFLNTADFKNLGSKIAEFLNKMGDEINFEQLGRTVRKIKLILWNILYGAVTGLEWDKWATRISDYILGSLNELAEWINTLSAEDISKALSDFFGNIKYTEIKDAFVNVVQSAWRLFVDTKDLFLQSETGQKITKKLKDFFANLTWADIKEQITTAWTKLWAVIDDIWPKKDREQFASDVAATLKSLFNNVVVPAVKEIGTTIADALWNGIMESKIGKFISALAQVFDFTTRLGSPIFSVSQIISAFAEVLGGAGFDISTLFGSLSADVQTVTSDIETNMAECGYSADAYLSSVEQMQNGASTEFSTLSQNVDSKTGEIKSSLNSVRTENSAVSSSFRNTASNTRSAMNDMNNSVRSNSNSIVSAFQNIINKAKEAWNWAQKAWNNSAIGSAVNNAIGYVPAHANGGFPEDGLFFANHGEMVGKFSNGKTAVANNEQITNGIANAVYGAFVRAFAETGGGNNDNAPRVAVFNLNGREFARATYEDRKFVDNEHGMSLILT